MTTFVPSEMTFEMSVERASLLAGRVLRSDLGAHTYDDVVSVFIENQVRRGKSEEEIKAMLSGPGIRRCLENVKNDLYRRESAAKRGMGLPCVSYEEAEPFLGTDTNNPETEIIRKEELAVMENFLDIMLRKSKLSAIQLEILKLDRKGFTNEEIARELGVDVHTVYTRRSEAQRKLASAAKRLIHREK